MKTYAALNLIVTVPGPVIASPVSSPSSLIPQVTDIALWIDTHT